MKRDGAAGSLVDQAADLVAMPLVLFKQRKHQQLGASAFELLFKPLCSHICL